MSKEEIKTSREFSWSYCKYQSSPCAVKPYNLIWCQMLIRVKFPAWAQRTKLTFWVLEAFIDSVSVRSTLTWLWVDKEEPHSILIFLHSLCLYSYRWHSQPNFLFNKNKQNNSIYLCCNLVLCNLSDSCLVYSVLCHTLHFHIHHGDTDKLEQTALSCEWKVHLLKKLWCCLDREQKP